MSFCNNCKSDKIPGVIRGNGLSGLCEKACIQVEKVFDACMSRQQTENVELTLTNVTPSGLTEPYTFVSARSQGAGASVTDVVVTDLPDLPGRSRVQCNVVIPVQVTFVDAAGKQGTATSSVTLAKDVVMCTPQPSLIPYSIQAVGNVVSSVGTYDDATDTFTVTACITVILKVIMPVQLLVPSYGYCYIPPCQEYNTQECAGVFELPLYPQ